MEAIRLSTNLGDMVRAGGQCETAVNTRTRCWWLTFREYGELLYEQRFYPKVKWVVNTRCLGPESVYGNQVSYLN